MDFDILSEEIINLDQYVCTIQTTLSNLYKKDNLVCIITGADKNKEITKNGKLYLKQGFHLHWPDYFFVKSKIYTYIRILYFLAIIMFFKIQKTKLIWTIHNLQPHKNYHPILFDKILKVFLT